MDVYTTAIIMIPAYLNRGVITTSVVAAPLGVFVFVLRLGVLYVISQFDDNGRVAKLADAYASGAYGAIHGGSSPLAPTVQLYHP